MKAIKTNPKAKREKRFSRKDLLAHWMMLVVKYVGMLKALTEVEEPTSGQIEAAMQAIDNADYILSSFVYPLGGENWQAYNLERVRGHFSVLRNAIPGYGEADPEHVFSAARPLVKECGEDLSNACNFDDDLRRFYGETA